MNNLQDQCLEARRPKFSTRGKRGKCPAISTLEYQFQRMTLKDLVTRPGPAPSAEEGVAAGP